MTATTIPILPSRDFDRTAAFYEPLGFVERARYPGEYLILTRESGIELHLWSNPRLRTESNDAGCFVRFPTAAEARDLHDRWAGTGMSAEHLRPPEDAGYNLLEFALLDCDRNVMRVGGFIEPPA